MPPAFARYRVEPGEDIALGDVDPADTGSYDDPSEAREELAGLVDHIADLQARLYAEEQRSVLVVLQGIDAAGKDSTAAHVFRGTNPQGVRVYTFKEPSNEESAHDFLWRYHAHTPAKGMIHVFNRSHYEDVLIARVRSLVPESVWSKRYDEINRFEREVTASGTTVVKICLHISFNEQRKRLLKRLMDPTKRWKFNPRDLDERELWPEYQVAYDAALFRCSSDHAPWYVVPANKKWYRNWAITRILIETLEEMDPRYPEPDLDMDALTERLSPSTTRAASPASR